MTFVEVLELFNQDPRRSGHADREIRGTAEEEAADYIRLHFKKPVVAFIADRTRLPAGGWGTPGGHLRGAGSPQHKMEALADAGAVVVANPADMARP